MTDETTTLTGNQSRMTAGSSPMTGNRATANRIAPSPQAAAPTRAQPAQHPGPVGTRAVGSAWSALPDDARHAVSKDIFDRFSLAQQATFHRVYAALKRVGYWGAVRQVTAVNLKFHQIDATLAADLKTRLTADLRFCGGGGKLSSFRQVVRPPGTEALHIKIQSSGPSQVHLDTVSPVIGRRADGSCSIGVNVGMEHGLRDFLHVDESTLAPPEPGEIPF
jgi:hypothetical protein